MNPTTLALIGADGGDRHAGGFLFFLLLLGAITFGIVYLIRRRRGLTGPGAPGRLSARSVLDERFARGDIDRAEYEHRRAVLDGADTVPPAPPSRAPSSAATAVADPPTTEPSVEPSDESTDPSKDD